MARLCCLTQLGMLLMGVWLAKGTVRISLGCMVEDVKRTSVHWPSEPPRRLHPQSLRGTSHIAICEVAGRGERDAAAKELKNDILSPVRRGDWT